MNIRVLILIFAFSQLAHAADFPPYVEEKLTANSCENFEGFSEQNETSEYPFQYGYTEDETIVVWCKWRTEGHLLVIPRDNKTELACLTELKSSYISAGGLQLLEKPMELSLFRHLDTLEKVAEKGFTNGQIIHSNWAGAGTYLYCHNNKWVYFNHD